MAETEASALPRPDRRERFYPNFSCWRNPLRPRFFAAFCAKHRREHQGEINHLYGGRGVYFDDPSGHLFEIITRPYGETPEE